MKAGWEVKPLGELTELITKGSSPKWQGVRYVDTPGVLFVTSENVGEHHIDLTKRKYVEEKFNVKDRKSILQFGDVLTNIVGASIGRTAVFESAETANINQAVCLLRCAPEKLSNHFLSHLLNSPFFLKAMHSGKSDMARANLSLGFFRDLEIPLPPLEEQKRIVAVLDAAFEGLARARTHAEANLQNARELFESSLETELEAIGSSHETSLGEHIDLLAGYAFKSKGYTEDQSAMRLMRGDNIVPGAVRWEGAKYWPIDDCEAYKKFQLRAGDVLIAMDRTWIKAGIKYAVLRYEDVPSLLVQRVARLRCLASLDSHFLALLIGSKSFERYVLSIQTGTGVPHISPTQIRDFKFPLPDVDTQTKIVERLLIVKNSSSELSEACSKKLEDLDDLRQSLLQKAFAGELT